MALALMILLINGTLVSAENPMMQNPDIYGNTLSLPVAAIYGKPLLKGVLLSA